jgi:hypothetical protein
LARDIIGNSCDRNADVYTAPNAAWLSPIVVTFREDGGTANGGIDMRPPLTLVIDTAKPHSWHNSAVPCDVDQDTFIAPDDALAVINYINSIGSGPIAKDATLGDYYSDVDGDGFVAPGDALVVINYINANPSRSGTSGGEGEAAIDTGLLLYLLENGPDRSPTRKAITR